MVNTADAISVKIDYEQLRPTPIKLLQHPKIQSLTEHLTNINNSVEYNSLVILWDVDTDGLFSGFITDKMINRLFPKIKIHNFINKDKTHGIKRRLIQYIKKNDIKNLIVVDAGTNDIKEIKELVDMGVHVTVIDHHEIHDRYEHENFILINCKECEYGKEVSGAYLVNDVFKQIALNLNLKPTNHYDEPAVISIISDICKRDFFNRNILMNYTMGLIEPSPFMKIIKKGYHKNNVNSAISITSSINALLRQLGTEEMMRIFTSDHALLQTIFYNANKIKGDNDEIVYSLLRDSKVYDFINFTAVFIQPTIRVNIRDYTSIIANKVSKQTQKLCIVLLHKSLSLEEYYLDFDYSYSIRDCYNRDSLSVFKSIGIDANGHKQAFGGKLKGDIVEILKRIDSSLTESSINPNMYGQVIDTENLFDGLTKLKDSMYNIALWNTLSLDDERIGFKFKFNGNIIKKRRMIQLMYNNLIINSFDMTIKDGDTVICFPELDGTINFTATKFRM